ncbi:hypothetical protein OAE79_02755 [Rhodopirellula sp.]|nr:hypothetical protein [Rhodopirellula sp.]MDB4679238.1 hypothetical protein [Rhodopirellula sp.]
MPLHRAMKKTSTTRASFYLYNTPEEAEQFVSAIEAVQNKFAKTGRRRRSR